MLHEHEIGDDDGDDDDDENIEHIAKTHPPLHIHDPPPAYTGPPLRKLKEPIFL